MEQFFKTLISSFKAAFTRHLTAALRGKAAAATALVLVLAASCGKDAPEDTPDTGTGDISVTVNFKRSDAPRTAKEGNVMNNLSVWIVRQSNGQILKYRKLTHDTQDEDTFFAKDWKTAELKFTDIERGDCVLYAVANYDKIDADKYAEGETIDNGFKDALLDEVKTGEEPSYIEDSGMPCSVVCNFGVRAGENKVEAHLLRCVGRISIYAKNHIDYSAIFFKSIGMSDSNPSKTYLFHHDGQIPADSKNVAFKDLDGLVKVDAKTVDPVLIYDTYLYETDPNVEAGSITFELFGAMYRASVSEDDVTFGYRKKYSFDENNKVDNASLNDMFLIRSAYSNNYYLGDDGKLTARFFSGDTELRNHDGIDKYFWKFSGTSTSTLTNVGTGRQLKLDGTTAEMVESGSGTSLTLTYQGTTNGLRLSYSSGYWNRYWLSIDADKGLYGYSSYSTPSSTNSLWYIRKVNEVAGENIPYFSNAEYEIPRAERPLTYIDNYGIPQDIVSINRNDHLEMVINIFYNRELGEFDFTVEEWRKKDSETTFD